MTRPDGKRATLRKWDFDGALLAIGGVALVIMMIVTVASAVGNTLFNRPVPDVVTLNEVLMAVVVFLPLAFVQFGKHHIEVTLATDWLPPPILRVVKVFAMIVSLVPFSLLAWALATSSHEAWAGNDLYSGEYTMPTWPWRAIAAVGAFAMVVRLTIDIVHAARFGDDI